MLHKNYSEVFVNLGVLSVRRSAMVVDTVTHKGNNVRMCTEAQLANRQGRATGQRGPQ